MLSQLISAFPGNPIYAGLAFDFFTDEDLNAFVYSQIASGTAAVIDTNLTGNNGILFLSSVGATDNKGAQIQLDAEPFQIGTGRDIFFQTRFSVLEVVQSDYLTGLAITNAAVVTTPPTDGVYFYKADGAATCSIVVRAADATIGTWPIATLAADTFLDLAFSLTSVNAGAAVLRAYVNGTLVLSTAVTGLPTSEALAITAAFQSGEATLNTANLDYIGAWQSRFITGVAA